MKHLFTQSSFPGTIPNHVAPETPGSIHECGGLGYSRQRLGLRVQFDRPTTMARLNGAASISARFGVDIGHHADGIVAWAVVAPTSALAKGALAGT